MCIFLYPVFTLFLLSFSSLATFLNFFCIFLSSFLSFLSFNLLLFSIIFFFCYQHQLSIFDSIILSLFIFNASFTLTFFLSNHSSTPPLYISSYSHNSGYYNIIHPLFFSLCSIFSSIIFIFFIQSASSAFHFSSLPIVSSLTAANSFLFKRDATGNQIFM
jgi:hypothetical protein